MKAIMALLLAVTVSGCGHRLVLKPDANVLVQELLQKKVEVRFYYFCDDCRGSRNVLSIQELNGQIHVERSGPADIMSLPFKARLEARKLKYMDHALMILVYHGPFPDFLGWQYGGLNLEDGSITPQEAFDLLHKQLAGLKGWTNTPEAW